MNDFSKEMEMILYHSDDGDVSVNAYIKDEILRISIIICFVRMCLRSICWTHQKTFLTDWFLAMRMMKYMRIRNIRMHIKIIIYQIYEKIYFFMNSPILI